MAKEVKRKNPRLHPDSLLSTEQAANYLGCPIKTIRSAISRYTLPGIRIAGCWFLLAKEVEAYQKKRHNFLLARTNVKDFHATQKWKAHVAELGTIVLDTLPTLADPQDMILSGTEVALALGHRIEWTSRSTARNSIPSFVLGSRRFFLSSAVAAYLKSQDQNPPTKEQWLALRATLPFNSTPLPPPPSLEPPVNMRKYCSTPEAARILKVYNADIINLGETGYLTLKRYGKFWLVNRFSILNYQNNRERLRQKRIARRVQLEAELSAS